MSSATIAFFDGTKLFTMLPKRRFVVAPKDRKKASRWHRGEHIVVSVGRFPRDVFIHRVGLEEAISAHEEHLPP